MIELVTLEEASMHLRRDTDDDDALLAVYVQAASGAVLEYVGDGAYTDEAKTEVRPAVKSATLLLIGDLYRFRESSGQDRIDGQHGYGYLPYYVTSLLFPYRKLVSA